MGKRIHRLNIQNTDKAINLHTFLRESLETTITKNNLPRVSKELSALESRQVGGIEIAHRNDHEYRADAKLVKSGTQQNLFFKHAGKFIYVTPPTVGFSTRKLLSEYRRNAFIEFKYQPRYTDAEVRNVILTSTAGVTQMTLMINPESFNPYEILTSLYALRYHLDKVYLRFKVPSLAYFNHHPSLKRYYFINDKGTLEVYTHVKTFIFLCLREAFSLWKMNMWVECDNEQQRVDIAKQVDHYRGIKRRPIVLWQRTMSI